MFAHTCITDDEKLTQTRLELTRKYSDSLLSSFDPLSLFRSPP